MDEKPSFEKRAMAIEAQFKEKLMNQKYYRSVNIDVAKEEGIALDAKDEAKKKEEGSSGGVPVKSPEDYKAILRGMGFKID